jgi:GT2 family glycosyltransferase
MTRTVPVAVLIPTYNRGSALFSVLEKIRACNPRPIEIWIHVDQADGNLERELKRHHPEVGVLTSPTRLGPGGGRHRCVLACNTPYAASFDDDSHPVDADFFGKVEELFSQYPRAAIFGASIWHRDEAQKARTQNLIRRPSYIGCGYAIRLAAYRQVRGTLPRPVAYGMEETDLSIQLFVAGWEIYEAGALRVFHNTQLKHHESAEINAGWITNAGLFAFLHFPVVCWGWGLLQVGNRAVYSMRMGRFRGICSGLLKIPIDCYRNRRYRNAIPRRLVKKFLEFRRTGDLQLNEKQPAEKQPVRSLIRIGRS